MNKTKRQWAYHYFLKSKRWKTTKAKVLEKYRKDWERMRFNIPNNSFRCNRCYHTFPHSKGDYHHINYISFPGDGWTDIGSIIIVCKECHKKIHNK